MVQGLGNVPTNQRMLWTRERVFLGACSLVFFASAAATIYWCPRMYAGMPMPGGWNISMAWMRMPGQGWLGVAATFMGTWVVMMMAMMLPSLVPMLLNYRRSIREAGEIHLGFLTLLASAGYFFVWAVFGALAYSVGVGLVAAETRWPALARSVPTAVGILLLLAGSIQFTAWKTRELSQCRNAPVGGATSPDAGSAWRHGIHLGGHCSLCCSGLMVVLLAVGVMNLGAMGMVAAAITIERLVPWPERAVRVTGVVVFAAGVAVIAREWGAV